MNRKRQVTQNSNRSVISVHTRPETSKRLGELAAATRRSKSFLANEALERYLQEEEAFVASINEGIADAEAGRVYTTEEAKKRLKTFINTQARKK